MPLDHKSSDFVYEIRRFVVCAAFDSKARFRTEPGFPSAICLTSFDVFLMQLPGRTFILYQKEFSAYSIARSASELPAPSAGFSLYNKQLTPPKPAGSAAFRRKALWTSGYFAEPASSGKSVSASLRSDSQAHESKSALSNSVQFLIVFRTRAFLPEK